MRTRRPPEQPMAERLLEVGGLTCGYGEAVVLSDVSFTLDAGRSLALLGRNGTGKTTLIDTIVGVTRRHAGRIALAGQAIHALPAHERAAAGIGWVPQERNIFKSLTVEENLTAVARPGPWTVRRVFELFPRLAERRRNLGNQLSGGEQQMLAVGRALILNPRLMLLDEPLEGLAPILVDELLAALRRIVRANGVAAIVVEQNAQKILSVTDRVAIIERGMVIYQGRSADLKPDGRILETHLGVTAAGSQRPA